MNIDQIKTIINYILDLLDNTEQISISVVPTPSFKIFGVCKTEFDRNYMVVKLQEFGATAYPGDYELSFTVSDYDPKINLPEQDDNWEFVVGQEQEACQELNALHVARHTE